MTEKQAYQLSLDLWIWLFKNPDKRKRDSPYWDKIKNMESWEPLCQLNEDDFNFKCCGDLNNEGKENCFSYCFMYAFYIWDNEQSGLYSGKISSAYIASKIRRHMRKKGWIE